MPKSKPSQKPSVRRPAPRAVLHDDTDDPFGLPPVEQPPPPPAAPAPPAGGDRE